MRTKEYANRSTAKKVAKACARNPPKGSVHLFEGVLSWDTETIAQPAARRPVKAKRASRMVFVCVPLLWALSGKAL
jgi:hypothetical protein